jgi:[acyl-carrier-protein] S-malonyltransferase
MLTLLCSGQGTQHAGMFRLTGDSPAADHLFAASSILLGADPREWVQQASSEALRRNRPAQILCVTQALAARSLIDQALPERFLAVGYSVGQVSAWGIAGLLAEDPLLALTARRAELMDLAGGEHDGLVSVRGLPRHQVESLARLKDLEIAIINPGDSFILGGRADSAEAFREAALEAGAQRSTVLAVSVASHTSRLAAAVPALREAILSAGPSLPRPGVTLLDGLAGETLFTVERAIDTLSRQIAEPVNWAACLGAAVERGTSAFLELGPGRALADMATAAYPEIPARSLEDFASADGALDWITKISRN